MVEGMIAMYNAESDDGRQNMAIALLQVDDDDAVPLTHIHHSIQRINSTAIIAAKRTTLLITALRALMTAVVAELGDDDEQNTSWKSMTPPPTAKSASHITILLVAITRPSAEPEETLPEKMEKISA